MKLIDAGEHTERSVNKLPKNIKGSNVSMGNSEFERQNQIAVSAYYRAEKRGFIGSEADALNDWLEAEKEIKTI